MSLNASSLLLVMALLVWGCHHHHDHDGEEGHHHHGEGHAAEPGHHKAPRGNGITPVTSYAESTELFLELPVMRVGETAEPVAHLSHLATARAVDAATVVVEFSGGGPVERFEAMVSEVKGIYRPQVTLKHGGTRQLRIVVSLNGKQDLHDLGSVEVAQTEEAFQALITAARSKAEGQKSPETITFTKEQQWRTEFGMTRAVRQPFRPSFEAYGTIRARPDGQAHVTPSLTGMIQMPADGALVKVGDTVNAGDTLAVMIPQLQDTADVAALEETIAQSRLTRARTKREVARLEPLVERGVVAPRRLLDATYAFEQAAAAATTAQRRLRQAKQIQRNGSDTTRDVMQLRSPIAGTVVSSEMVPGSFVTAGTKLFHIIDLSELWLEVHVTEIHTGFLEEPKGAWFSITGLDDDLFEAGSEDVVGVGAVLDSKSRTLPLYIKVNNTEGRLRVGMFADVHVLTDTPSQGLGVPTAAILQENGQAVVYVCTAGESFERRLVQTGLVDRGYTEVVAGLQPEEWVVSKGAFAVRLAAAGSSVPEHGHHH